MFNLRDIMMRMQLQRLIPEQHVVIIERDGQADRLEGPGYVKIDRLTEQFGQVIKFGPLAPVELLLEDARSAEGDVFGLQLTITYGFDPKRCNIRKAPGLVRNAPAAQEGILKKFGQQIAHQVIGGYSSSLLRLGSTRGELELAIKSRLRRAVLFAGIELYNVIVERLTPPPEWDAALRATKEMQVRLELAGQERTKLAQIEALETEVRAKAEALATQLLGEAGVKEKEILFKLLAELNPELAKQITNTEALSKLATNGGSVNVVASPASQLSALLLPLLMQDAINNTHSSTNGKENGVR
jgi:hypothetical protein